MDAILFPLLGLTSEEKTWCMGGGFYEPDIAFSRDSGKTRPADWAWLMISEGGKLTIGPWMCFALGWFTSRWLLSGNGLIPGSADRGSVQRLQRGKSGNNKQQPNIRVCDGADHIWLAALS